MRILELPSLLGDVNPQLEFPNPQNPTKTVNGLWGSRDRLRCLVIEMAVGAVGPVLGRHGCSSPRLLVRAVLHAPVGGRV